VIQTDPRTANEQLIRTGYAAFAAGDMATLEQLFRPDFKWHAQRLGVLSGTHDGWPAFLRFLGQTMELTNGSFTVTIEDVLTNEDGVAVVARSRAEREGRRLDDRQVHLFRLDELDVACAAIAVNRDAVEDSHYPRNVFFTKNSRFAGRSPRRRIRYGYHSGPYGVATRTV